MGMSLPFLVRALVRDRGGRARRSATSTRLNTLGAAVGALLTPVGAGALPRHARGAPVRRRRQPAGRPGRAGAPARARADAPPPSGAAPAAAAVLRAAASRCGSRSTRRAASVALSLEILWFRLIDVAVKSTGFTFGTVLAVYLAGCGLGTLARRRGWPPRPPAAARVPALPVRGILLYAGLAVLALVWLPPHDAVLPWFFDLWGGRRSYNLGGAWHVAAPSCACTCCCRPALYGPPTVLMGLSFVGAAARRARRRRARSGRRSASCRPPTSPAAWRAACSSAWSSLTVLGSAGTLRVLLALGVVLGARSACGSARGRRALRARWPRRWRSWRWRCPASRPSGRRLHGTTDGRPAVVAGGRHRRHRRLGRTRTACAASG